MTATSVYFADAVSNRRTRFNELNDAQVLEQLEARRQADVGDIDDNIVVDYGDVMDFMRGVDEKFYRGDIATLDALAAAIRAGQPEASLVDLSVDVLGSQRVVMTTSAGDLVAEHL